MAEAVTTGEPGGAAPAGKELDPAEEDKAPAPADTPVDPVETATSIETTGAEILAVATGADKREMDAVEEDDLGTLRNTGAAVYDYPVAVPPGRAGVEPDLVLRYNSFLPNGWLGLGWALDLGAIQRATKHGLCYDDSQPACQEFVVIRHGSGRELVPRPEWGADMYGLKVESEFTKYQAIRASGKIAAWIATDRAGIQYKYGSADGSRQTTTAGTFKWCLDRVEDTNGNYLTATYTKDQGQIYLQQIDYTGNARVPASPTHKITFDLEDGRPDQPPMFESYSQVVTAKRLKQINVWTKGVQTGKHSLVYTVGTSKQSWLSSITQCGNKDGTQTPPIWSCLPATSFSAVGSQAWSDAVGRAEITAAGEGYSPQPVTGPSFGPQLDDDGDNLNPPMPWVLGDFNGDGRTDLGRGYCTRDEYDRPVASGYSLYLSSKDGTWGTGGLGTLGRNMCGPPTLANQRWVAGDFDGDGSDELAGIPVEGNAVQFTDFGGPAPPPIPGNWVSMVYDSARYEYVTVAATILTGDWNGDGRTDVGLVRVENPHNVLYLFTLAMDGSWQQLGSPQQVGSLSQKTGDFNGDGRT
ncbi:MAG: SpvB/TcaC N-terminal domain-containing protein, partial [Thermodesulfobacteriota bacterium]